MAYKGLALLDLDERIVGRRLILLSLDYGLKRRLLVPLKCIRSLLVALLVDVSEMNVGLLVRMGRLQIRVLVRSVTCLLIGCPLAGRTPPNLLALNAIVRHMLGTTCVVLVRVLWTRG